MAADPPSAKFLGLLEDEWDFRLQEDPLYATHVGVHRYNDRLPQVSEADFKRRLLRMHGFRETLREIPRARLTLGDQLNYDLFGRDLDNRIDWIEFRAYRMPISKTGGFHTAFPDLPQWVPLNTPGDYENYVSRLRAFRRYITDHLEIMRAGIREGQVPARITLEGVEGGIRAQIVDDPARSELHRAFSKFPNAVGEEDRKRLTDAGRLAIDESVVGGYEDLLRFLLDEYKPSARSDVAATTLPNGRDYYAYCIRRHATFEVPPEAIHATGLGEVRRIRAEMEGLIRKTGFEGTFKEFVEFLRREPRFYADAPEVLLKETSYVLKRIDGELPRLFKTLPRMPYGIRQVPEFKAPGTTTAYYESPTGDGSRAGFYYVNTYDLKSRPLYEIEALSLHEAVPGHHLQIALQQELKDIPNFRRFSDFTAFIEGWALYAERLGIEIGFFQDPYSDFSRLSYEMWRACRLVVDTGMHAMGWSRERAIEFMAENTPLTRLNIENEIDRYIAWPGQALAYKLGELKIRELRGRAEKALGPRFDVRDFHDLVLGNGSVPLDVLEELVVRWITDCVAAGTRNAQSQRTP